MSSSSLLCVLRLLASALVRPSLHLFFLESRDYPPPVHSFPTRRSSDLICDLKMPKLDGRAFYKMLAAAAPGLSKRRGRKHLDRKSTRLNSSHEWISYAVFCLKKKTGANAH